MKKQIVIAFALLLSAISFAQKSELKTAEKAIKSGNFADAKAAIQTAESLIESADEKTKAKFYFLKGQALYAGGTGSSADIDSAIDSFKMVSKVEGSKNGKYTEKVEELKIEILNSFLTKANAALQSKDYVKSSQGFEKAYRMSPKDTLYLYYAASTAVSGQDYDTSLGYYEELKDLNYQGVELQYLATNKESGEEELFDSQVMRDASVRTGSHIVPKTKKTESKSAEIVKNIALIHLSNGDDEKALMAMKDARDQNPDDLGLLMSEANVQLKMGNKERFKALMEEATLKDPKNPELQFNLGVISGEANEIEAAKGYYEKAIALDPSYADAYINMAVLILGGEQEYIDKMNALGTSAADDKKYNDLQKQKNMLYETATPYLETALSLRPKSVMTAKTLMNIYSTISKTDKFKEMKAKVEALEAGN